MAVKPLATVLTDWQIAARDRFRKLDTPRAIKTWALPDVFLPPTEKHLTVESVARSLSLGTAQVTDFAMLARVRQRRLLASLPADFLSLRALTATKNWFVITIDRPGQIMWQNDLPDDAVIFFMVRQGPVTIVERQRHREKSRSQFVFVDVDSGVQLRYLLFKEQAAGCHYVHYYARVALQAQIAWRVALRTKGTLLSSFTIRSVGSGASSELSVGTFGAAGSRLYVQLFNDHQSENGSGNILYKGLGRDQALAHIDGRIGIGASARYANSYLQEDALLLSPDARIVTIPDLEILNNEVKASHGATVGRLDETALYYLQSRGLSAEQAERLVLSGFFHQISATIPERELRQACEQILIG